METPFENILISTPKNALLAYFAAHEECFEQALRLALTDKQPYSFRAAWLLCLTMKRNDMRLRNYVPEIISILPLMKHSQQRQLLIILQQMEIPQELEGQLFALCMTLWENTRNQQSVRSNALKMMLLIAKKYPELQDEISHLTDDRYLENFSHGIKHSVNLMIKNI